MSARRVNMKLHPQDLQKIARLTLEHYDQRAEEFWEGTRDHNVSQNIEAISACTRCYREEASVGQSRRTAQSAVWLEARCKAAEEFLEDARSRSQQMDASRLPGRGAMAGQ
jgi:hypothetical protein